ncbi:MAG: hypothetical protein KBD66_00600 [Candidatus Doudnabacteria bacterium]|nr:hypothetical protein [Candidatus Doudnabacteria bacterium]
MSVIAIVGCAGVGKSVLVKQLAALHRAAAFFEGEEGVFPDVVTQNLVVDDPVARERWFVGQYVACLQQARAVTAHGVRSYVDNASAVTIASYAAISPHGITPELSEMIEQLVRIQADYTVILTASPEVLRAHIATRGRKAEEEVDAITAQALRVQEQFVRYGLEQGAVILDRTNLNFHNPRDLAWVSSRLPE